MRYKAREKDGRRQRSEISAGSVALTPGRGPRFASGAARRPIRCPRSAFTPPPILKTLARIFVAFALLAATTPAASAQKYRTAIGVRLARPDIGLTITQRLAEHTTLEVLGSAASNDLTLTVLARQHTGILGHALNLYGGLGPHIGNTKDRGNYIGGTLALGVEWKIPIFPLVVSYDWMPSISSNNREKRFVNSTGVSLRFVLFKEKKDGFFRRLFDGKGGNDRKPDRADKTRTI